MAAWYVSLSGRRPRSTIVARSSRAFAPRPPFAHAEIAVASARRDKSAQRGCASGCREKRAPALGRWEGKEIATHRRSHRARCRRSASPRAARWLAPAAPPCHRRTWPS
eukprot:7343374-Prymnesium_polylepis.1